MINIKASGLTKRFGQVTAVDNLNLEIEEAEIFGLVGPDGSGKTTVMRLLTGILEPTEGDAWVYNKHIVKESEEVKDHIGYMPQRFGLYDDLTVMENINFYADIYGVPRIERSSGIKRIMEFSGLEAFKNRLTRNLSGGMKQKLGLGCALIHTPKILFLDEPTSGVDPLSRRDFWQILYQLLKEHVTIFFSTTYLDEAERCKRVGLIHNGRLVRCDSPARIKKEFNVATLEEAFVSVITGK